MALNSELVTQAKAFGVSARVEFDKEKFLRDFDAKTYRIQKKFDAQVMKDSNIYCPMDTSMLQKSVILASVLGSGRLTWLCPYAKKQYYGVNFDHSNSHNPNATAKWFETAKAKRLEVWRKLVDDEYHKNP